VTPDVTDYDYSFLRGDNMFFSKRAGHRFVDRGDPDAYDFIVGNLFTDGGWHDLDLSSIIPKTSKLVILRVVAVIATADKYFEFKKKGVTNNKNTSCGYISVASIPCTLDVSVAPNNNGVIEYIFAGGTWLAVNITVAGWFI